MEQHAKVVDRGALYYPFIHVRDEQWLKATLLCFPFVDRMVPAGYEVNDGEAASFFAGTKGRLGRHMLSRRDLDDLATERARATLLAKLEEDLAARDLVTRFSRQQAKAGNYADGESAFQIHEYKLGSALVEFLRENGLAWAPPNPVRGDAPWWAVHPTLGEAIMSTNAVALATANDLEIVTSDRPIHQALLGATADDVYDTLVRRKPPNARRSETEKVNDLARVVIVSAFDFEKLSLPDIAALNREGGDLSALKAALLAEVENLGAVPNQEIWHDVLAVKAKEVVAAWHARTSVLSVFSRVNAKQMADDFEGVVKEVASAATAISATTALVGALPGIAVGVFFGAARLVSTWRESQRPYRFLSRLARTGARSRHLLEGSPV